MSDKPAVRMEKIDRERGHHLLHQMLRIRRMEERCADLYAQTKIRGFLHLYIGEEAVAVGVIDALDDDDAVLGTYREHGHALMKGLSAKEIMAEMYGKVEGCSRGRGGSMHLFSKERRFFGGHAIVGAGIPPTVGLALADKMQGRDRVTAGFMGDGSVAEGEFHESMNLAALWKVPALFCCENNFYAMGTALDRHQSQPDLHLKAASYGIPSMQVDGMDVLAVNHATRRAVEAIRNGEGPYFIEFLTYRFRAHSMFDPELYRDKSEVEKWKERDPIKNLSTYLRKRDLLTDDEYDELDKRARDEIEEAVKFAEEGNWEPVEELERFVYSERPDQES